MDFELIAARILTPANDEKYINDCCIGCDEIIDALAPTFADHFGIPREKIVVYQEDWGWAMELEKDGIAYHTGIANQSAEEGRTVFRVVGEAQRKEKGWIFTKHVRAEPESEELANVVSAAAKNAGFEIRESEFPPED